jgi:hypothetical protein
MVLRKQPSLKGIKIMRKLIIAIVMAFVVSITSAHAGINVTEQSYENVGIFARRAIPDVTEDEVAACYDAVKNGGEFTIERKRIKIECGEEEMVVFRRLF